MSAIDEYLQKNATPSQRKALEQVRDTIRATVPEAEDTIGYGIPVMKYKKKYLLGFGAFNDHMSLFPGAMGVEQFKDKLEGHKIFKGTVQFSEDKLVPANVIKEMVLLRKSELDK